MSVADLLTIGGRVAILEMHMNETSTKNINKMFDKKFNETFEKKMNEVFAKNIDELIVKKINEVFEKKAIKVIEEEMNNVYEPKMKRFLMRTIVEKFRVGMNDFLVQKLNESDVSKKETMEAFERIKNINEGFESKLEQLSDSVNNLVQERESRISLPSNQKSLRIMFDWLIMGDHVDKS